MTEHPPGREPIESLDASYKEPGFLYPKGIFSEVKSDDIPKNIVEEMLLRAHRYSLNDDRNKPISYFKIEREDGFVAYGIRYDEEYRKLEGMKDGEPVWTLKDKEPAFALYETDNQGAQIGRGSVRFLSDLKIPIVNWVESEKRNTGLGTERYLLMSALSRKFFGMNLYSSTLISPEAERIWKKFVENGKAEVVTITQDPYDDSGRNIVRYRLKFPE